MSLEAQAQQEAAQKALEADVAREQSEKDKVQAEKDKAQGIMMKPPVIFNPSNGAQDANKLEKMGHRVWESAVLDAATWQRLSVPLRDAEFSKFVIDTKLEKCILSIAMCLRCIAILWWIICSKNRAHAQICWLTTKITMCKSPILFWVI